MAKEVQLMVTQPVHGSHGDLIHQVGELFPLGTELGPDVRVAEVIVDVPDAPEAADAPHAKDAPVSPEKPKAEPSPEPPAPKAVPGAEPAKPTPPAARPGTSRGTRSSHP